ncbi:MAG: hypothetical protein ACI8Y4_003304 [Candidatus Poriferisodalaceae bacterium]|jgi:hypothetical protein
MYPAEELGTRLAERHRDLAHPLLADPVLADPVQSLLNHAERSRVGDWSTRSALMRLAQPEPVRVSRVLESVRRCDGALHPMVRALIAHTVTCDRGLTPDTIDQSPSVAYVDGRITDLARLVAFRPDDADLIIESYRSLIPLTEEECFAVPLLMVAVELDRLGDIVAAWANHFDFDPPVELVDEIAASTRAALDDLGIDRETGPPPRGRRGSRP